MSETNIRPLVKGEVRDLGGLFPNMSNATMQGKVVKVHSADSAVVEVTYMGVYMGDATLTKEPTTDGHDWSWTWN